MTSNLRLFGSWNYGYSRHHRSPGRPGQQLRATQYRRLDRPQYAALGCGFSQSALGFSFGGDWTPTAKLVVSARYGYFFNNNEQRGTPVGTRYVYQSNVSASTVGSERRSHA